MTPKDVQAWRFKLRAQAVAYTVTAMLIIAALISAA